MSGLTGAFITQMIDENDPTLGFAVGWVNALAKRLTRLEVICLAQAPSTLAPDINVSVLPAGRWARYRRVRSILRRLKRGGALDFVLAHMCPSYAVAATVPSRFAPTLLWYAHSSVTRMLRLADRLCDGTYSCSAESYPLAGHHLTVVGHGIDTERFMPAERTAADVLRLCAVGRITRLKRLDLLINTLERFRERSPQTRVACRIVGPIRTDEDKAYAAELKFLVEHKGLDDIIAIEQPLRHTDVAGVYQAADVIVNMTERHSLDKTTLEAMACGCLVLTTNESFAPVLGPHAETMVRPHTSSGGLEGALEALASMPPDERARIGLELRDIVERDHSLGRMMDRIIEEIAAVRQGGTTREDDANSA